MLIAETADFYVSEKPAGINFHDSDGAAGFVSLLRQQLPGETLFPVHRLDRDTSGLLLFARHKQAAQILSRGFAEHRINKLYWAVARGAPKKKQGAVIGDMAPTRDGSYKLLHTKNRPAHTHFFSYSLQPGLRAYLLRPYSGRTHQLRVAMKSLSVPILGDERYGRDAADRMYLHATALRFDAFGTQYVFFSPPTVGTYFGTTAFSTLQDSLGDGFALPWPRDKRASE